MTLYPIYKYGENDFSLGVVETREIYDIAEELFSGNLFALSEFLDHVHVSEEIFLVSFFRTGPEQYKICSMKDTEHFYDLYRNDGYSERGTKRDILRFAKEIEITVQQSPALSDNMELKI